MAFLIDFQLHDTSHQAARAVRQGRTIGLPAETPQIPPPDISAPTVAADTFALPTVQECATHLELLHSIYRLREDVQSTSSIHFHGRTADEKLQSQEVRARRWDVYLRLAVLRFLKWMHVGDFPPLGKSVRKTLYVKCVRCNRRLDILMVWQACLLDPVFFSNICTRRQCQLLRSIPFPWKEIHAAIQADGDVFRFPQEARVSFEANSALASDMLELLSSTDRGHIFQQISTWLPSTDELALEPTVSQLPVGDAIVATLQTHLEACGYVQIVANIAAAVDRQYNFVEKMEQFLWLRSPAVHGTIQRAISRYDKFVKLLKKYPKIMLVPTIDIDLVWHTHQCAGSRYQEDMEKLTGTFIDHDDRVGPQVLQGGENKTSQLFRLNYGSEYLRCFCWDCETVLSELEHAKNSGQRMNIAKRKELARRVATLVSSYKAAEIARRNGPSVKCEK